jgi:TetR/AcrR family acrAB operon transcriptional repressor
VSHADSPDIVAAAQRLRAREGARFTLAQLARAAGVSRATLYRRLREDPSLSDSIRDARGGIVATRSIIRTAAIELLKERGLRALTMDAIAQRAAVSTATLYRHFDSRDALLREITRGALDPAALRSALEAEGSIDQVLTRFVTLVLSRLEQSPHLLTLLVQSDPSDLAAIRLLRRQEERVSVALLAYLQREDVRPHLRDLEPERLLGALVGQVLGALLVQRLGHTVAPLDPRTIVTLFLDGVRR